MTSLTAQIYTPAGQSDPATFRIVLRLHNQAAHRITVSNPDMGEPSPAMHWPWSNEIFQISMLISFRQLSMSVTDGAGQRLPQRTIQTWATPVIRPKLGLSPGQSFALSIPIGSFYELARGRAYRVTIGYGDRADRAVAHALIAVP